MEKEIIKELHYAEIDLVGDLSDANRIEDKILFTVCSHVDRMYCLFLYVLLYAILSLYVL